jgi:hypothetical protein
LSANKQLIASTLQFEAHETDHHAHHTKRQQNLPHHAQSPEAVNTRMLDTVHSKHGIKRLSDGDNLYEDDRDLTSFQVHLSHLISKGIGGWRSPIVCTS